MASATASVNVNVLAASGADAVEPISGMSHLTAIPVEIVPADGPVNPGDCTGRPVA